MGYGGKYVERARARELRAQAWTLQEIANELGVAKGSVSVWVRDVDFVPKPRNRGHPAGPPHPMRVKKEAEIDALREEADELARRRCRIATSRCTASVCTPGEGAKTAATV